MDNELVDDLANHVADDMAATWQPCGTQRGSHVADDVAATWQTTWQPRGRRRGSHMADDVAQNLMAKFNSDHNSTKSKMHRRSINL
jgi:hypothetical protein